MDDWKKVGIVAVKRKSVDMIIVGEIVDDGVIDWMDLVSVDIGGSGVDLVVADWMDVGPWVDEK